MKEVSLEELTIDELWELLIEDLPDEELGTEELLVVELKREELSVEELGAVELSVEETRGG